MPPASPDRNTWKRLIEPALRIIDSLQHSGYGELDFRLGGGTVLMFRFDHRVSKDIDIFFHDAQALTWLTPRLNEVAEGVTTHYQEQPNALKLTLRDGDIDFIVAAPVIPNAFRESISVAGREIVLDATSEILAKKLAYRADAFTARDALDMSVALQLDRPSAVAALEATRHRGPALMARLELLNDLPTEDLAQSLHLTETGAPHAKDLASRLVRDILAVDRSFCSRSVNAPDHQNDDEQEV